MTTIDYINVLLKEYDALKREIEARTNNGYQLLPLLGVLMAWLLYRDFDLRSLVAIVGGLLFFALAAWAIFRDIAKAAERVTEIELMINELAGRALLEWETKWGMARTGYFRRLPFGHRPPFIPSANEEDGNQPRTGH